MVAFYGCFHGRSMGALSLTASKSTQRKGFGALLSGIEHIPYPYAYRLPRTVTPRRRAARKFLNSLKGKSSSGCSIPNTSQASLSSPFREKVDMLQRRSSSCKNCSESAANTGLCSSSTKCSREWAAPENGGPVNTLASNRTFFALPGNCERHATRRDHRREA